MLKKPLILLTDPKAGCPLGGELTGYRKLVVGRNTWRVVYRLSEAGTIEVCEIWAIGARADAAVYAEAAARVRNAAKDKPEFARLADVVDRLGRLADGIVVTVGLDREVVAAMDLQQAVDQWTAYMAQPRQ